MQNWLAYAGVDFFPRRFSRKGWVTPGSVIVGLSQVMSQFPFHSTWHIVGTQQITGAGEIAHYLKPVWLLKWTYLISDHKERLRGNNMYHYLLNCRFACWFLLHTIGLHRLCWAHQNFKKYYVKWFPIVCVGGGGLPLISIIIQNKVLIMDASADLKCRNN